MIQSTPFSLKKDRKIKLLKPLAAEHSALGLVDISGLAPKTLIFSAQKSSHTMSHGKAILKVFSGSGEIFVFEGETLTAPTPANIFYFQGTSQAFLENLHRLVSQVRKNQHIEICEQKNVEATEKFTGFSELSFLPDTVPELDESDLSTESNFLGRTFDFPLLITGMTGGVDQGHRINLNLAKAASEFNIPMGVGSQRIALEHPQYTNIFTLKNNYPDLFLLGNLGFSDLILENNPVAYCQQAVDMIDANALAIHLNLIQECVQIEGNRKFKGFLKLLEKICASIDIPIVIKEVGCGIRPELAKTLESLGVQGIDVGGLGGTSWSQVESFRADPSYAPIGECFRDWGIPTAYSLLGVKEACPNLNVTATGGIRDGQTVAKACALGASLCGLGLPLFKAALKSSEDVSLALDVLTRQLKITMLGTGSSNISHLAKSLIKGRPLEAEFNKVFANKFKS